VRLMRGAASQRFAALRNASQRFATLRSAGARARASARENCKNVAIVGRGRSFPLGSNGGPGFEVLPLACAEAPRKGFQKLGAVFWNPAEPVQGESGRRARMAQAPIAQNIGGRRAGGEN
jgi:hypothetical protein